MRIRVLEPTEARGVREWYDVRLAAGKVDLPADPPLPWGLHLADLNCGWGGELPRTWVAEETSGDGAAVVGGAQLILPAYDNTHCGVVDVVVHPDARRRGIGRALVDVLAAETRAAGRRLLIAETPTATPGPAFWAALGGRRGLRDVRRVLQLGDRGDGRRRHAALLAEARERSAGYSIVRWAGEVPEERLADIARLQERMSDAPVDDLEWEPEVWTGERIRAAERRFRFSGERRHVVAARHDGSGRLVAFTAVFVSPECPTWGGQGDTVVLPEHRGSRLGLLVKCTMLADLRELEPQLRCIATWNAASNTHMVAINEALGFVIRDLWEEWQLPL
jgi:GNAT superfamily N-acetyltransferase